MSSVRMFKDIGGYHNALPHEVDNMIADGWEIVSEDHGFKKSEIIVKEEKTIRRKRRTKKQMSEGV